MIAMALACRPDILIADEPTTALDVTIQAQILSLIQDLQAETGMSVIFITHDLGVIAETCDAVAVMYAGRTAETAPVEAIFRNPRHPYTRGLLSSIPRLEFPRKAALSIIPGIVPGLHELPEGCRFQNRCPHAQPVCRTQPPLAAAGDDHLAACHFAASLPPFDLGALTVGDASDDSPPPVPSKAEPKEAARVCLEVRDLQMHFPIRGGIFRRQVAKVLAVDGISFSIRRGETLGLVGESGCGKTTAGRSILRLYQPTAGTVNFNGRNILTAGRRRLQAIRRDIQMIFQDPFESLNSRLTVRDILEEPFIIHRMGSPDDRRARVLRLLKTVGMPESALTRFPHEFSGGQRQRIGIARAIALNPEIVICDEPVSALDVSIQSQILNLLLDLQKEMGLTYLFISHDLTVVRHISDQIAVMYLGKIVELTDADSIYASPLHPYTRALLSAIPVPDPAAQHRKQILSGDVPSPVHPPSGCRFRTRCPIRIERCTREEPLLRQVAAADDAEHWVACHRV
jgi:peptide/nickel transport system ATP-binding protein